MFRRWISGFWKDNKEKILQIGKVLGLIIAIGVFAGMFFSSKDSAITIQEEPKDIYRPTDVPISGGEISQEKYEEENLIVEDFVEFCNEQNSTDAYNLLTDECKEKLYPTLEDFENKYYKKIFTQEREYNIQAWLNEKNYTTYKIRYTDDFMETGTYEGTKKYEDYITVVTDGEDKKININGYIKTEQLNNQTNTDKLEIEVVDVDVYTDYVTYTLNVKNTSKKDILLDTLENEYNIKLIGTNGYTYKLNDISLTKFNLEIGANRTKEIKLTFMKKHGSDVRGARIQILQAITDYKKYRENEGKYDEFEEIIINL